jgi:nicotinamide-nucleotide amidase
MTIQAELVAIGSELVLGQIVDTNTSFMAKRLAEIGIEIVRTATVGDALERMESSSPPAGSVPRRTISPARRSPT